MNKGFTLIELGVVVSIIAILLSITTISLTSLQQHSYLENTVETVISDMKHQQLKAMSGSTEGEATHEEYGIYFEPDRYTLFRGTTYDSSNPYNFSIVIPESLEFRDIVFPSSLLIFEKGSGEMMGYSGSTNTVTIYNIATNESKTIVLNQYGVITDIN